MYPITLNKKLIENQNTELKLIWKDEYLKHICAFANSKGGFLYLGLADDSSVVGIQNTKKLLEDIPNKSIQFLGIYIDVDMKMEGDKAYLKIKVEPSSVPVSFKGVFYKRSGSTTQELKGAELQTFILKKSGKTFDDLPLQYAMLKDIDDETVTKFVRKAIKSNRISSDSISDQLEDILTNLKLFSDSGKLKNAAILLFGRDPNRFFTSVSFKIGRFGSNDHDLKFQNVIEGNIFEMPDKVMEILRAKYLISPIRYEGLQRIEELEYPEEALREAILNAIIHKNYSGVHIQLSIYDDKIILWNPGELPMEITIDQLKQKHPSIPRNRNIADIFFKAGYIEAWGRGIQKITDGFTNAGYPEPVFEEFAGGFQISLFKPFVENVADNVADNVTDNVTDNRKKQIIKLFRENNKISLNQLAKKLSVTKMTIIRDINELKNKNIIKRIGPAKGGYWKVIENK